MPHLIGNNAIHTVLTVTDLEISTAWYERVFDAVVLATEQDFSYTGDQPDGFRFRVLVDPDSMSQLVGLQWVPGTPRPGFDRRRTGLDHLGFHVAERSHLDDWATRLESLGVDHSGVVDRTLVAELAFSDPDDIELEIAWTRDEAWLPLIEAGLAEAPA